MDHDPLDDLIGRHLDGVLDAAGAEALHRRLVGDPAAAGRFARAALVHDRLADLFRTGLADAPCEESAPRGAAGRRFGPWGAAAAALAVVVAVAAFTRHSMAPVLAASLTLDRAVAAAAARVDREYRIDVLDHGPGGPPAPVTGQRGGRKPGIDGARLFVRGGDAFVLVRRFADGTPFVTGSDGAVGWAAPPHGAIHLSHDTRRFRRAVPGERDEIPFLDLRDGLDGLRRGYELSVRPAGEVGAGDLEVLVARRRVARAGSPELVMAWIDRAGVPRRIEIRGLGSDAEGATAVALSLVREADLGPGFFAHESHHAPDRPIDWE